MSSYQKKYVYHCLGAAILLLFLSTPAFALDIIPGLKGFGTDTRAAYGANTPEICIVDSLLVAAGNPRWDATTYSVGVFRGTLIQCLEGLDTLKGETIDGHVVLPNSGKIILFEVSGTIRHKVPADEDGSFRYNIGSYTTIAGQTSPKPGILLRNICMFGGNSHDIFIQHLRGRMDGTPSTKYPLHKSFQFPSGSSNTYNIVIDHVSTAWGADGQIEFFKGTGELHDITMSNCILAESIEAAGLTDTDGDTGKNSLIGGSGNYKVLPTNILFYLNLFSNTRKRNPRLQHVSAVLVNNYMYNNRDYTVQLSATSGPVVLSLVGNVLDAGPMSNQESTINKMLNLGYPQWEMPVSQNKVYLFDNTTDAGTQVNSSDWRMVIANKNNTNALNNFDDFRITGETPSIDAPLWPAGLNLMSSSEVKKYIIANVGAYPAFRDSLDTRFISEMINGRGPLSPKQGAPAAGDWPTLAANKIKLAIPPNPHADDDGDGYTNLEEWLHSQAAIVEGKSSLLAPEKLSIIK